MPHMVPGALSCPKEPQHNAAPLQLPLVPIMLWLVMVVNIKVRLVLRVRAFGNPVQLLCVLW